MLSSKLVSSSRSSTLVAVLAAASVAPMTLANGVAIGHTAAGKLVHAFEMPQPLVVEPSIFAEFPGFATGLWGFESAEFSEPDADFYELDEAANIEIVLTGADANMFVYNGVPVVNIGEAMSMGAPPFDFHPIFNITAGSPGQEFELRFKARDLSGLYADSDEFSMIFRVPCGTGCVADYDSSGGTPDASDIDAFFSDWLNGAACADADFSGGTPDASDIDTFFAAWLAGGC